jgi:alkane 1-monooxygenase
MVLENANYIEHYGLVRVKDKNGIYESISPKHSWNSPSLLSNHMLFKLSRHSDHHMNVYKPYQILNTNDDD